MDRDPYFENNASKYAAEAIRFDSQGFYDLAIQSYRNAIEDLVRSVLLHPNYKLNNVWLKAIIPFRIKRAC